MNRLIFSFAAILFLVASCQSTHIGFVSESLAKLSTEDKANLILGTGMPGYSGDRAVIGSTESIVPGAAGTTYPLDSLGIPAIVLADGPAGLRINPVREGMDSTFYCTHFPIGTLLASTWNDSLVEQVGAAMGEEVKEYGVDVLLAPALNIHRSPLNGRNFEYYSEDPVVAGKTAAAFVRGVQRNGVGTSIKHFTANNQETNRMNNNVVVTQRALREIYLRPFEIAVKEGHPWTVMSSYNYINGKYASENKDLLETVLRGEWGFDGVVMTDWFGGYDGAAQVAAGNDMLQPGLARQKESILRGIGKGTLSMADLDKSVTRILGLIEKTPRYQGYAYSDAPDLEGHADIARKGAAEGMVLLKNADALPLASSVRTVALYGCTSYDLIAGGTGSGDVHRAYIVSLPEGLKDAGYNVIPFLERQYNEHITDFNASLEAARQAEPDAIKRALMGGRPKELQFTGAQLRSQGIEADIAIITIGRQSGEFFDRAVEDDFMLSADEYSLIESVCKAYHAIGKKVVVLLNTGGVIETASWKKLPDAILCAWQSGQEGGHAVADVLSGAVSPSGKLTMTWPVSVYDHPSMKNFPVGMAPDMSLTDHGAIRDEVKDYDYTLYEEDIYVGYRYFDTFGVPVSYPFGFGLSYTDFAYGNPIVTCNGEQYCVTLEVTNTGSYPGKEVVQLYAAAPDRSWANKPERELRAYAKTGLLAPGASQTLQFSFSLRDLASFDEASSALRVTSGKYQLLFGASSRDIRAKVEMDIPALSVPVADVLAPIGPLTLLSRP